MTDHQSRQWNDDELRRRYERVKKRAKNDGFSDADLAVHYLDALSHQIKSGRIMRMAVLSYNLGQLRAIADVDEGHTPVTLDQGTIHNPKDIDEIETLRAQAHNLTLYLQYAINHLLIGAQVKDLYGRFDGLPGYAPAEREKEEDDHD